ncbi:MAG: hypothetical protein KDD69_04400 [Bdellovibrionales bacterium]|nr:hypothetical protein [Bdellovibrionales bacterium]
MSAAPTLNSRLRVLIAKTFRAEKLYSAIPTAHAEKLFQGGGEQLLHAGAVAQLANDIRAKEWQQSHYRLRIALNDLLAEGSPATISKDLVALRERFLSRADESVKAIEEGTETLVENAERQEFAHIFKLSVELIRHKARAQASKVIADELTAVLDASGRGMPVGEQSQEVAREREAQRAQFEAQRAARELEAPPSNVIPLRRRFAMAGRGGR